MQTSVQRLKTELESKERDLVATAQKLDVNTKSLEEKQKLIAELQDPAKNKEVAVLNERLEKIRTSSREIAARDKARRTELKDQITTLSNMNSELDSSLKQKTSEMDEIKRKLRDVTKLYEDAKRIAIPAPTPAPILETPAETAVVEAKLPDTTTVQPAATIEFSKPTSQAIPIVRPPVVQPPKVAVAAPVFSTPTPVIPNPFSFASPSKPTSGFSFVSTSTPIAGPVVDKLAETPNVATTVVPTFSAPTNTTEEVDNTSPAESLKRERDPVILSDTNSKRVKVEEPDSNVEESKGNSEYDEEIESDDSDLESNLSDGEL